MSGCFLTAQQIGLADGTGVGWGRRVEQRGTVSDAEILDFSNWPGWWQLLLRWEKMMGLGEEASNIKVGMEGNQQRFGHVELYIPGTRWTDR